MLLSSNPQPLVRKRGKFHDTPSVHLAPILFLSSQKHGREKLCFTSSNMPSFLGPHSPNNAFQLCPDSYVPSSSKNLQCRSKQTPAEWKL